MSSPFPNEYNLREVAGSDSKACSTCYKPTTSVLVASNKGDFFYVCPNHLLDESYARPVHPEAYQELIKEKTKLTGEIGVLNAELDAVKPYVWSKITSSFKSEKKLDENSKTNEEKYKELQQKLKEAKEKLDEITGQITQFKFKKYSLDKDIYKMRLNSHLQQKYQQKRQQELSKPGFFPLVPQNNVS